MPFWFQLVLDNIAPGNSAGSVDVRLECIDQIPHNNDVSIVWISRVFQSLADGVGYVGAASTSIMVGEIVHASENWTLVLMAILCEAIGLCVSIAFYHRVEKARLSSYTMEPVRQDADVEETTGNIEEIELLSR